MRRDELKAAPENRRGPSVAGARQFRAFAGAAPAGVLTHSTHPGGVGAPPGDTTIPCQELADVDVRSFAVADARLWNGAETVARSLKEIKSKEQPLFREMRGPTP